MKILVCEPKKASYLKEIDGSLESMQMVVGGYTEVFTLENDLVAVLNVDGRLRNLPVNPRGILAFRGTFFVCAYYEGCFVGLDEKQIREIKAYFLEDDLNDQAAKASRLTSEHWRNLDPWECCGQDDYCKRRSHEKGGCNNGCIVPRLYNQLARYEDLGLSPDDVKSLMEKQLKRDGDGS